MELLRKAAPIAMLAFVVSSMLAVGLSLTVGQILAPLRNKKLVFLALAANFLLMPLGVGLAVRARLHPIADKLRGPLNRISTLSLGLLIVLLLLTNIQNVVALFGTRGVLASILFLLCGAGIGWLLGGPGLGTKGVLALGTAQRNIAAALVVGGQNFDDPRVLVMVVMVAVVGLLILMPLARALGARSTEGQEASDTSVGSQED